MRTAFALVVAIVLGLAAAAPARADFDQSQAWFNALPLDQRTDIQSNLILLGFYNYLVDGAFGQGTYTGLTAFQHSLSRANTGVLSRSDIDRLTSQAKEISDRFGLETLEDETAHITISVPSALLTDRETADSGTIYKTADDGIVLETLRQPLGEKTFDTLYDELTTEGPGRIVGYRSYNDDRFVVSGTDGGKKFYLMYRHAGNEAVGYNLTWAQSYHRDASILSVYLASHADPTTIETPSAGEAKTSAVALRKFGAFTLPDSRPYAIMLNDEIGNSTAQDFEKALAARPDATVLLLNSPGGYVNTALVIANEVHQHHLTTMVPRGSGCYSACAYIYFAGSPRQVDGELGVHQIYTEVNDLVYAQTTISDILDALDQYGVKQGVISHMFRTPPEDMYVFTQSEIAQLSIDDGGPLELADLGKSAPSDNGVQQQDPPPTQVATTDPDPTPPSQVVGPATAFVHLARFANRDQAERSLTTARSRWSSVLGNTSPEIEEFTDAGKSSYHVLIPAPSLENANAMCAAIKSSGGACYVTPG